MRSRFIAAVALGSVLSLAQPAQAGWHPATWHPEVHHYIRTAAVIGTLSVGGIIGGTALTDRMADRFTENVTNKMEQVADSAAGKRLQTDLANGERVLANTADLTDPKGETIMAVNTLLAHAAELSDPKGVTVANANAVLKEIRGMLDPKKGIVTQNLAQLKYLQYNLSSQIKPGGTLDNTMKQAQATLQTADGLVDQINTLLRAPQTQDTLVHIRDLTGQLAATMARVNGSLLFRAVTVR